MKIGLILYTVRELLAEDFEGTLKKVAEIGFKNLEVGLPLDGKAKEQRETYLRCGLKPIACHTSIDALETQMDKVISAAKELDLKHVYLAWIGPDRYANGWKPLAKQFNEFGKVLKDAGLQFGYHNHDFEFALDGDQPGLWVLADHVDPELVKFELDCYWALHAGHDPVEAIRRLGTLCTLTHWKDKAKDPPHSYCEVGEGLVDWVGVKAACEEAGCEYGFIEMDQCPKHPLESIRIAREAMLKLGLKD